MNKSRIYSILSEHQKIIDNVARSLLNVHEASYTFASARINDDGLVVTYESYSNMSFPLPPIVLQIYTHADQQIMANIIEYCVQLYQQCSQSPVLLCIFSNDIPPSILDLFIPYPDHSHVYYLPNTVWARECLLIPNQKIKKCIQEDEKLDELVALSIFLLHDKREIVALTKDPTIKYLCDIVESDST